jgi:Tol biopolymer transport system component
VPAATTAGPDSAGLIVFHQSTNNGFGSDALGAIWTVRPDGTQLRKLLGDECIDCYGGPRLSPDATRIAYGDQVASGSNAVFVMNSDGTNAKAVCIDRCDAPIAWSPDGHQLAVSTGLSAPSFRVAIFDLASRRLRVLRRVQSVDSFDWSPDGGQLAVATTRGVLWSIRPDGTHAVVIGHGLVNPRWSPDGKFLLVTRYDGKGTGTVPAGGGKFTLLPYLRSEAAWSPDGRQILYAGHGLQIRNRVSGRDRDLNPRTRSVCDHPGTGSYDDGHTYCNDFSWQG